ncbi:MAG: tetratricopeptide (TPR) repeat protein [Bacillariaceae sp.]|jgi:tetratricopeptide (TPR) repeat protein
MSKFMTRTIALILSFGLFGSLVVENRFLGKSAENLRKSSSLFYTSDASLDKNLSKEEEDKKADTETENDIATKYNTLGNNHMNNGNAQLALQSYTIAIKNSTDRLQSHIYYSNRADTFDTLKRYKEAVQDSQSAIDALKPVYGDAHARLGLSKYLMNDLEGSISAYETALRYDSNNTEHKSHLAEIQHKLRRKKSRAEKYAAMKSSNNEKDALLIVENSDVKNATNVSSTVNNVLVWNEEMYQTIQVQGSLPDSSRMIRVDNEAGYINKNGQLVVDVNETFLFWDHGQEKLCNILRNMTLASSLEATAPVPSTVLNVTMDCIDQNTELKQGLGQGNWVTAVYASRMAAYLAGVDFKFQCLDGRNSKMILLLPWFDRHQVANPMNRTIWPYGGERPNAKEACPVKYPFLRIDKMALQIQDDLRKMAVTLVGTRDEIRWHPDVPVDAEPLIPNIQLDDVALHFRCGDVLGGANRNDFGMIRFNEYKKWIPIDTESIGILTQPFEKERNRGRDSRRADDCRTVVFALVEYLQDFAPKAKITIHNDNNETLPLAYARLVMANYAITSLSSFGIFPIVGTFGQGYFQKGNRGVNPFATYIPSILDNIHEMEADVRGTGQMKNKSVEDLVGWFVNDTAATK